MCVRMWSKGEHGGRDRVARLVMLIISRRYYTAIQRTSGSLNIPVDRVNNNFIFRADGAHSRIALEDIHAQESNRRGADA